MSNTEKVCSINIKIAHGKIEANLKLKGTKDHLSTFTDKELINKAIQLWDELYDYITINTITIDRNF